MSNSWSSHFKIDDVIPWHELYDGYKKARTDYVMGKYRLRDLVLIGLFLFYGRRIGEIHQLKKENINPKEQIYSKDKEDMIKGTIKFPVEKREKGMIHFLPLVPAIKSDLILYRDSLKPNAKLFKVTKRRIRDIVYSFFWEFVFKKRMICRKCGYERGYDQYIFNKRCPLDGKLLRKKKRRPHVFRHALILFIRKSTGDIELAQKWVGHKSIQTTMSYGKYDATVIVDRLKETKLFFM